MDCQSLSPELELGEADRQNHSLTDESPGSTSTSSQEHFGLTEGRIEKEEKSKAEGQSELAAPEP